MSTIKAIPDGYHTLTPYLLLADVGAEIEWLRAAFGAETHGAIDSSQGFIRHAEVRIGDSPMMLGSAGDGSSKSVILYMYVEDVDAVHRRAVAAGGRSIQEPTLQFYGDRTAAVEDPAGNQFWIATHVEDVSPEQLAERAKSH
ncbi:MAG: VOC family protein [Myxococcales bacterium]|nr:VOC family protein [Myxococcales bacterium]